MVFIDSYVASFLQTQLKEIQEDRDRLVKDLSSTRKRVEELLSYKRSAFILLCKPKLPPSSEHHFVCLSVCTYINLL